MSALPASREPAGSHAAAEWAQIAEAAPQVAATMRRYLTQVAAFLAPRSVEVADAALRQLARWILINGVNFGCHPSHYRPDHIGWQPWDAIDGEHVLCQRGLPDPRSASHKVDDMRTHTGILLLTGVGAAV